MSEQWLARVFEGFGQKNAMCKNARRREEGISDAQRLCLGFQFSENELKYDCLNLVNDVLNKFNLNEAICTFC